MAEKERYAGYIHSNQTYNVSRIYSGIYIIVNRVNNKKYIGKSININQRISTHIGLLRKNRHGNMHLQRAWNKYEENNFDFKIIEFCNFENLSEQEKYWIRFYESYNPNNGYNKTFGGDGEIPTEETREKLRVAATGRIFSEETKRKIGQSNKGKLKCIKRDDHFKIKISKNNARYWLGKKLSSETKLKISIANTGKETWMKGKTHTEESKIKMSKKSIGKKLSIETKEKMSNNSSKYWQGKNRDESTKNKISEKLKKLSDKQTLEIVHLIVSGKKQKDIAKEYNVSPQMIGGIKKRHLGSKSKEVLV